MLAAINNRYIAGDSKREEEYDEEVINAQIARKIFELRTKAGLTQQELADRVGTSKSAICRLEDADYEGHGLSMLKASLRLSVSAWRFDSCRRRDSALGKGWAQGTARVELSALTTTQQEEAHPASGTLKWCNAKRPFGPIMSECGRGTESAARGFASRACASAQCRMKPASA